MAGIQVHRSMADKNPLSFLKLIKAMRKICAKIKPVVVKILLKWSMAASIPEVSFTSVIIVQAHIKTLINESKNRSGPI